MRNLRLDRRQIEVVDDEMAEVLRHKTPAERLAIAFALCTSTRDMLISHLKGTHPDWSIKTVKKEVVRRMSEIP